MHYLAEAVWYLPALLPHQGVRWHPVDDTRARATLTDGKITVDLTFAFSHEGWTHSVHADAWYRRVNGRFEATAWEGSFWNYEECDGAFIPMFAEVAWELPEGSKPYWRAHIEQIAYEHTLGRACRAFTGSFWLDFRQIRIVIASMEIVISGTRNSAWHLALLRQMG